MEKGVIKMSEIDDLKKENSILKNELDGKQKPPDNILEEEESKKLPKWTRHKCIECGKNKAGIPVYHHGKRTGYICELCINVRNNELYRMWQEINKN
jgi:hypothetical protein